MAKSKEKIAGTVQKERLSIAEHAPPGQIRLVFCDGFGGEWPLTKLEIETEGIDLDSIRASRSGATLELKTTSGTKVVIDAATARILVDPRYAAEFAEKTKGFILSDEKLLEVAEQCKPPQWWIDESSKGTR